jgi:hypothetical protein
MKRISLAILLTFIAFAVNAQITGGNVDSGSSKSKESTEKVFKKYFNLKFSSGKSMGTFGKEPINSSVDDGMGVGLGASIDIGQTFFLHNIELSSPKTKIAIEATYLSVAPFFSRTLSSSSFEYNPSAMFVAMKIGASVNVNTRDNIIVGAKFKLEPTIFSYSISVYDDINYSDYYYTGVSPMIRSSLGVFARKKPFYVGLDLSFGKTNMTLFEMEREQEVDIAAKTSRLDIVVGFSF